MRRPRLSPSRLLSFLLMSSACTVTPRDEQTTGIATLSTTIGAGSESSSGDDGDPTGMKLDAAGDSGGVSEIAEVFGHSATTLYRLDPTTKQVTVVGDFVGCDASIIDIALDADSNMYGAAFGSLWSIDRTTAACTHIADGEYPTSLSFVPAGTVDPDREALVGFVDADYIRIDTQSGAVTPLGTLAGGLASSGDLVAVAGGGTYLTVTGGDLCGTLDCVIELDPSDGTLLANFGTVPYPEVFGLAFWAGRAYGFARSGDLFEIDFVDNQVTTTAIQIPGAPASLEFFGAGSTTSAPPAEG
ncbi:MAG: hypothetical protein IPK74_22410 [Deltaproteobacteria bacterium]|nr:hypothetical protein [Deltaproteobacteria bacterium]